MEVRVQHEPVRSSYCCEILTLSLQSKEVCFISKWFESQNDAELDAFQSAAQSYGLLDEQVWQHRSYILYIPCGPEIVYTSYMAMCHNCTLSNFILN